ncbi:MAG: bifunctional glutamate N-acetyltransferase/amino-acid acetyltransferase ArgJ [Elusimicrobia bacterium]|nr:bifunctional glutamate N-acetyltransferase/amino-acid acetyltransferase ArgJ [Elusimicrobiota bacterium]
MNFPKGFFANGVHCGIKKNGNKDISVFYSKKPCIAAGKYTKNIFKAAPVIVSRKNIKNKIHAIIVNSGCANACTGRKGIVDAEHTCDIIEKEFNVKSKNVLVASTGVIGQYLPMDKISKGIKKLSHSLTFSLSNSPISAAQGIMTTDTTVKVQSSEFRVPAKGEARKGRQGSKVTIWGCAKGSGMIEPTLGGATMLSFILTDAVITKQALNKALTLAVDESFNCLTVDSDTSTNDTVFLLANTEAKNKTIDTGRDFKIFSDNLTNICVELTKMLAKDGEGATKLITINVKGARNKSDAKKVGKVVANSPLVKTAIFGNDANWGRIVAAVGRSGIGIKPDKLKVSFDNICVFKNSKPTKFPEKEAKKIISEKEVPININLNMGKETAKVYTCDFTGKYIDINASYRT